MMVGTVLYGPPIVTGLYSLARRYQMSALRSPIRFDLKGLLVSSSRWCRPLARRRRYAAFCYQFRFASDFLH